MTMTQIPEMACQIYFKIYLLMWMKNLHATARAAGAGAKKTAMGVRQAISEKILALITAISALSA